jgi:membrane protein
VTSSWKSAFGVARQAAVHWSKDGCSRFAAALSYYAIFSLFPLGLLCVTGIGAILGSDESARAQVVKSFDSGSADVRALIDQTLQGLQEHQQARGVGAVVGVVTLLFGASGVFSELDGALDVIFACPPSPQAKKKSKLKTALAYAKSRAVAFLLVAVVGLALLGSIVGSTVLSAMSGSAFASRFGGFAWVLLEEGMSIAFLSAVFTLLFHVLPRVPVALRDAAVGGIVAAVLVSVLHRGFGWAVARMGSYAAYGVVGAMLALLAWIHLTSMVIYFGAEIARAASDAHPTHRAHPVEKGAVTRPTKATAPSPA